MLTIPSLNPSTKTERSLHLKMPLPCVISDAALTFFEKFNEIAAVLEEAKQTAKNYTFSSMVCMFALSTVIQCAIQSYYPLTNDTVAKENWDSLAKMFDCTIYLRDYLHGNAIEYVHIFCCAAMPPSYLVDRRIPSTKNHFVTLCQPVKALQPGDHYFKTRLPTLLQSAMLGHRKVPPGPSSTQVTSVRSSASTKKQKTSAKRKQISLDALLPKK